MGLERGEDAASSPLSFNFSEFLEFGIMLLGAHVAPKAGGLGCLKHMIAPHFEKLSFFCDSVVLMLLACEPWRQVELGWEVHQVSSTLNFFFPLDSVLLMLHALGLEAPSQLQVSRILIVSLFYS